MLLRKFALAVMLLPTPIMAAVSGYYDSSAQLTAVLSAQELGDALAQLPVEAVTFLHQASDGRMMWRVEAGDCAVTVGLTAQGPEAGRVGPNSWHVADIGSCEPRVK